MGQASGSDITVQTPTPPPRYRAWLLFLLLALGVHALLLVSLPYWSSDPGERGPSVSVELAPIQPSATAAEATHPATAGSASQAPPPAALPPTPPSAQTVAPVTPTRPKSSTAPPRLARPAGPEPETSPPASRSPTAEPREPAATPNRTGSDTAQTPSSAPADADDWQDDYSRALRAALAQRHQYPRRAARFGLTGTAQVTFTIRRDGRFTDIGITASTGSALLDQAALDTVRRLGRFLPLPDGYSAEGWTLSVPLVYRRD